MLLGAATSLTACKAKDETPDYSGVGNFDSARVRVVTRKDTIPLVVEIARTPEQQQLGLMARPSLADGHGMLFIYDSVQDATAAFWMYRTLIPLDIAFIDSTGAIVSVRHMVPCKSPYPSVCPTYPAGARFSKALELPAGYLERRDIKIGDKLLGGANR